MQNTNERRSIKNIYRFSVIAICVFYALYFISVPILLGVNSDVAFKNTLLPQLVNFLGKIFEVCGIAVIYSIAVYSVYVSGAAAYGRAYVLCGASAIVKCLFAQTVYWLGSGGIPAFNNGFFEELFWLVILPFALEMLQFTIFFLIAGKRILNFRGAYAAANDAARARGGEYPKMDSWVYPIKRAVDLKNPLLYGCFVGGAVITVSKVLLSVFEEIDMAINGLVIKNLGELLISLAGFMSDVACGVLAYTVMVFVILKAFDLKNKEKQ